MPKYPWAKETELCAHFIQRANYFGWVTYPETEGFDILCVASAAVRGPFQPGTQIGIQAKLLGNVDVLYQALPPGPKHRKGPHIYGVLVPYATHEFKRVASRLQIYVFQATDRVGRKHKRTYEVSDLREEFMPFRAPMLHEHKERCWVPGVQIAGYEAGSSNPRKITKWKLQAVRLALCAARRGYLTSLDFKAHSVNITTWLQKGWIRAVGNLVIKNRRYNRYQLVDEKKPPHLLYPEVVAALETGHGTEDA